jgi:plastocyanin
VWWLAALFVCALLGLDGSSGGIVLAGNKTHPITVVSIVTDRTTIGQYKPRTVTVHRGDRIVFRNVGNAPHTVTATNSSFDSGTIFMKKSWTYTARKVGRFSFFCQFHAGMSGTIVVKP